MPFFPPTGGAVQDVTFPLSGNGAPGNPLVVGPGLNSATIYASPLGDDDNDGLTWSTAVEHGYVGYQKIVAATGGYLNIASGTYWGGPVTGQGAWIRGDGLTPLGWLSEVPCIIQGFGPSGASQFAKAGTAIMYAGSNDDADFRTKPGAWVSRVSHQVVFKNIQIAPVPGHSDGSEGVNCAFRIGWDYPRNEDGSIQSQAVSSSTRTSTGSGKSANGTTVHTCALLPAVSINSASRLSNVTTITIVRPGTVKSPPWKAGSNVWLQFTDVNFTSGAYAVVSCSAALADDSVWTFTVADPTAGTVAPVSNPGTVRSMYAVSSDLIDLQSSLAQFPSSQYRVLSTAVTNATTGTITVFDPYGGYNGVTNNSGPSSGTVSILQQVRGYNACLGTVLDTCSSRVSHDTNTYRKFGPMFDFGGNLAFNYQTRNCYMEGFFPTNASGAPWDALHQSSFLGYGDNLATFSGQNFNTDGIQACYRVAVGQTFGIFQVDGGVFNCGDPGGEAPPPYEINGTGSAFVKIDDLSVSDASAGFGSALATISGLPAVNVQGNAIFPAIQAVGPASNSIIVYSGTGATSPWKNLQIGTWADLQITGRHPAAQRAVSPTLARFTNLINPTFWPDVPASTGIADPAGGTGAILWDDTAHASVFGKSGTKIIDSRTDTFFAAGGKYVVAGWFNYDGGNYDFDGLVSWFSGGNLVWKSTGLPYWTKFIPYRGAGWQWVVFSDEVVSGSASQTYDIACWGCPVGSGNNARWFGLSAFWIPPTINDNDACEFIGTLKAQPYYLPAGYAGTFEGQKFIAHGGLGVSSAIAKTVGVGSGQLTLTGSGTTYIPVYAADGVTIQGWIAQLQATVNP